MKGYDFNGKHVTCSENSEGRWMATTVDPDYGPASGDTPELAALALFTAMHTDTTSGTLRSVEDEMLLESPVEIDPDAERGPGTPSRMSDLFPFVAHSQLVVLCGWQGGAFGTTLLRPRPNSDIIELPPHRGSITFGERPHKHVRTVKLTIESPEE